MSADRTCVGALLLATLLAATSPLRAEPAKADNLARARALDRAGATAYGEGRYAEALRSFEESYRLGGPSFELWNAAKCHLRLNQPERAAEQLERYLALPDVPKEDHEAAAEQLATLEKQPSQLSVTSTPKGAQVSLDGKALPGRTPLALSIPPGTHTVVVSSAERAPYTKTFDAKWGRPVKVDPALASTEQAAAPPEDPFAAEAPLSIRGALALFVPTHGSIGGKPGVGAVFAGSYALAHAGAVTLAAGGLVSLAVDSWSNRTSTPNVAPGCAPLRDAQRATALSVFGIGTATLPLSSRVKLVGVGGLGFAGYFVENVGGDLFVPSCQPSPGLRPALLFGAQIDYALTKIVRLSAFPLTWQIHAAFDGARSAPRDATTSWSRFGFGIGGGIDL